MFVVLSVICGERLGLKSGALRRWDAGEYPGGFWEEAVSCGGGDCEGSWYWLQVEFRVMFRGCFSGFVWWKGSGIVEDEGWLLGEFGGAIGRGSKAWSGVGLLEKKGEDLLWISDEKGEELGGEWL